MAKLHAATTPEISEREIRNTNRSRIIAAQGMVLLENDGSLPLKNDLRKIALYGNGARHTVKGGTGSGDVNSRYVINIEQGLENAGYSVTTKPWLDRYDQAVEETKKIYDKRMLEETKTMDVIFWMFSNPFQEPPVVEVTEEDIIGSDTDTAIYVISRNSGEGKDRSPVPGEYELFEEEKKAIAILAERYDTTILVLNVGGVIDTEFIRSTKGISAVFLMSQAGNTGGCALADVLSGQITPSGHLTSTWAKRYEDYPGASSFSHMNGNLEDEYYEEGIYVGYRYFDTFNVPPAYPFGYGLSYTEFEVKTENVTADAENVEIKVTVRNKGSMYSGREVVQIYYSAPQGSLEKPYQELAAYGKTRLLEPGERQTLTISYPLKWMASYDEENASYVLERGVYYIRVGVNSRDTKIVAAIVIDRTVTVQKLSNRIPLDCEMRLLSSKGIMPYSYEGEEEEKAEAVRLHINTGDILCERISYENGYQKTSISGKLQQITVNDVCERKASLDELVSQLTIEQMAELCVGTARGGPEEESVIGAASAVCPGAAGDTTSCMIESRNLRNMVLADGPAGLRLSRKFMADKDGNIIPGTGDAAFPGMELLKAGKEENKLPEDAVAYYQYCTAIPIATLLAQSWDPEVFEEAGDIVGEEMEELGVSLWLAPGMNIHRNPLCGRNFEYYSEDPVVSGMCAAWETLGVQKHRGVGTTIKHFAFNNQEDNRMYTNAHICERAIREIYLKGFEIAVRKSQPMSIMTSYNLINGVHTANSYDLLTAIARDEWGFEGIIMTDWGTTMAMEGDEELYKYRCSSAAGCIKAGNDLIMPGSQEDIDEIICSVDAKESSVTCAISLAQLQRCAKRMISIIIQSSSYEDAVSYPSDKSRLEDFIKVK